MEKQLNELNAALAQVGDDLKGFAEKSHSLNAETKATVDKLLAEQGELNARLRAAEQAIAQVENGNVPERVAALTIGQFVAGHDDIKNYVGGTISIDVSAAAVADATTRTGSTSGDSIVAPHHLDGIVGGPVHKTTVRDLLSWGTTSSDSIQFVQETVFTNNAGIVSENPSGTKPKSKLAFDLVSAPVVTIAHWTPASKQVLRDVGQMAAYIDGRLRYGLDQVEEEQILVGGGSGGEINGIYTQASSYTEPTGAAVAAENAIDRLRLALLQSELAGYYSDGIVLSPADWANIELLKNSSNDYLFGQPGQLIGKTMWGRRVVDSRVMSTGKFLVGPFAQGAQGWDREQARVLVAEQHEDFFIKNMVAIRAEKDIALTVLRPQAFIKGDLPTPSTI